MWIPVSLEEAKRMSDEDLTRAYMTHGLDREDASAYVAELRNGEWGN